MSKHTPGPWIVVEGFMGKYEVESANDRDTGDPCVKFTIARDIGGRVHGVGFDDYSEVEANIKLISASPDLLKALEEMVDNEEQIEFESWLSDFSPSGDVDSVTAQWLASSRFDDFCAAVEHQLKAIAKAKGE